jgi:hypothetical protein
MRTILFALISLITASPLFAQEFTRQAAEAKTAYSAGKLDDARFAMQQMMQELDLLTGKEILKILPTVMEGKTANTKMDNVAGASNFLGVIIHREYGQADSNKMELEVIGNSPMVATINGILSLPLIANNSDYKVIKMGGYKALVQKTTGTNDRADYEVQLPLNSSLITFKAPGYTQDQVIKMANTIPVTDIAKILQ